MSLSDFLLKQANPNDETKSKRQQEIAKLEEEFLTIAKSMIEQGKADEVINVFIEHMQADYNAVIPRYFIDTVKDEIFKEAVENKKSEQNITNQTMRSIEIQEKSQKVANFLHLPEVAEFVQKSNEIQAQFSIGLDSVELDEELKRMQQLSRGELKQKVSAGFR